MDGFPILTSEAQMGYGLTQSLDFSEKLKESAINQKCRRTP